MITIKGLEKYEILISKIPDDVLAEEYPEASPASTLIIPVLLAMSLKDKEENQEERRDVLEIIRKNEQKIIEEVGSNKFKIIVK